jgi:hypothetical protein
LHHEIKYESVDWGTTGEVNCELNPSFEKIETALKKEGFQWFLDDAI